jgi:hypothetical protein
VIEAIAFGPVVNGRSVHSNQDSTFMAATMAALGLYFNAQWMNSG